MNGIRAASVRKSGRTVPQNAAEEKSAKMPVKLERVLEYSHEFEDIIADELSNIRASGEAPSKAAESARNVVLCSTVAEKSSVEVMENIFETTFNVEPYIYLMDPSFDFRNSARVQIQRYRFDGFLDQRNTKTFQQTFIKPFIEDACLGVVSNFIKMGKNTRKNTECLEEICIYTIEELLSSAGSSWKISFSCLEIFGSKACDLLNMNQVIQSEPTDSFDKTGSVYGLSCGQSTFTEVPCTSSKQYAPVFSRVLKLRKSSSKAHFLCKIRLKHKSGQIDDSWINILDLAALDGDTDNLTRKSYMVLKECIRARNRATRDPNRFVQIPFQASKLTELLRESFIVSRGRQTKFLCLASFGPTLMDNPLNIDLGKFASSLRGFIKLPNTHSSLQVGEAPPSPLDWELKETSQWFELNSDIPKQRIPKVRCSDLLNLTQIQFLQLMKGSSPTTNTQSLLRTLEELWRELEMCKSEDKERMVSRVRKGFQIKESRWRGRSEWDPEDIDDIALGTSKKKFEAGINRGFEKNIPRYEKRTKDMMQLEWAGKVKASDRAEAKLYPILSIDTKQSQPKSRRNSIYE